MGRGRGLGGCAKGRHGLGSPWFVVGGSALIFVLITRNLMDFVILQARCQAFLSWQHAEQPGGERQPVGMMNRWHLKSFLSRCSLTLC